MSLISERNCRHQEIGQFQQHPGEDALLTLPLPAAIRGLVRTIGIRCAPPARAVVVDKDNPAQDRPVINAGFAVGLRKEGFWL